MQEVEQQRFGMIGEAKDGSGKWLISGDFETDEPVLYSAWKLYGVKHENGCSGKSRRLDAAKQSCPHPVAESISDWTNQTFDVDQNLNELSIIQEEISKLVVDDRQ